MQRAQVEGSMPSPVRQSRSIRSDALAINRAGASACRTPSRRHGRRTWNDKAELRRHHVQPLALVFADLVQVDPRRRVTPK
ncbi:MULTISPECIES: hypothetical protein [unclassified Bradyrhizobium]|uniref:hypothetical protein n=1 Tax=unclassified Bradyrhizobium TaxID=2631580 RepID=UPI001FF7B978|nr:MULTISPECIES: hypothetical protein [unclassified Bradyrhizobium]